MSGHILVILLRTSFIQHPTPQFWSHYVKICVLLYQSSPTFYILLWSHYIRNNYLAPLILIQHSSCLIDTITPKTLQCP